ncbi:MAG TPA: iron-sulfur cluster repair di-iron protein [Aeromicrobium sp.]|mgnify:CR=1 FL=1|nr:iron-sulfur cluster repair di-iron protein [Aeromicrobium sp.]
MTVLGTATLAELVIEDHRRAPILEGFGLDYCCGGQQSLADAVSVTGLDLADVQQALELPTQAESTESTSRENAELAHDILDTHHAYMWEEMPRLLALVQKVHGVHGERHQELAEVLEIFTTAVGELEPHMTKEERSVFPSINRLERTGQWSASSPLADQVADLVDEHEAVGALFKRLNQVTENYEVPADACGSYRAMLEGLKRMELDLHEHIHKENNILFPGALALLDKTAKGAGNE